MNGWLRLESEQRGAWTRQRVQDLRSVRLLARKDQTAAPSAAKAAPRPATTPAACAGAA
jgi:hypothetical protein